MFYKKALSTVMALMLSVNISSTVNATDSAISGSCGNGVNWNLNTSTGELTVFGNGNMACYFISMNDNITSVIIKEGVTSINELAFCECEKLETATIPNSVNSIGKSAFDGCIELTSVNIPNGVTKVSYGTFQLCVSLLYITIPDSIKTIGACAFRLCSLMNLTIPNSVTYIGSYAFEALNLNSVKIPCSVKSLGDGAFANCNYLRSVTYTGISEPQHGDDVFSGRCPLKAVNVPSYYVGNTFCNMPVIKAPTNKFTSFSESVYEKILYLLKFCQFSIAFLM